MCCTGEDPEGAIFLKFDRLSARNLLYLQSSLNELQAKLDKLDKIDAEKGIWIPELDCPQKPIVT